jgi:L-ascorbate metabolism protein UlaG (beta-lactamase superfamily)
VGFRWKLSPHHALIEEWLSITGGKDAAAVLVSHSHYDHVLDAPFFALAAGARIIGSESTANVARGAGMTEDRIQVIRDRDCVTLGKFHITFIQSVHSPALFGKIPWTGTIDRPLAPPQPAAAYREGGSFAILVRHPKGDFLHCGSAGIKSGVFAEFHADAVFLSIGGRKNTQDLIAHILDPLGPETVFSIHYDDLFGPLSKTITPLIGVDLDEFRETMGNQGRAYRVKTLPIGEAVVVFQ